MQIAKDSASRALTIAGVGLSIAAPFTEGHTCTSNEATVLNQILGENVRNNLSKSVKEAVEKAGSIDSVDLAALQASIDTYIETYEFGVRRGGGGGRTAMSPEDSFKMAFAKTKVKNGLKKKGHVLKTVAAAEITRLATEALAANPKLVAAADKAWKASQDDTLELDLDDVVVAETAADE